MKKNICIIGNYEQKVEATGGGTVKVRLFKKLLEQSGHHVSLVDIDNWKFRFLKILIQIKKQLKICDSILIMVGPSGSRLIIPLINFLNRKTKTRIVYCPVGIGTLNKIVNKLSIQELNDFFNKNLFNNIKDKKMARQLSKIDLIIPQNDLLTNTYKKFYKLRNCKTLLNFRDLEIKKRAFTPNSPFKICYLSRVVKTKGIFDLIKAVQTINLQDPYKAVLDIFGANQLNSQETELFNSMLDDSIKYKNLYSHNKAIDLLKQYDLFCFPTHYFGEGTPGVIVESLIAGTPVLSSSFAQVEQIIQHGINGFLYLIGDQKDFEEKLRYCIFNPNVLREISENAQKTAEKYTYDNNKEKFLEYILGK